tara:strand:+ start:2584 stop:3210 length:627 start_codon:yes stop_codon:yes gene_type:complete
MKYTDLRKDIKSKLSEEFTLKEFYDNYLNHEIAEGYRNLSDKFLEALYEDLNGKELDFDVQKFLSGQYRNSNEYAKDCVHMAYPSHKMYGLRVKGWTDSALKAFDSFLLIYIQDYLKEEIKGPGKERDKYHHLIEKGGSDLLIGQSFDTIYLQRNAFTHVEFKDENGVRKQRPLSKKRIRGMKNIILEQFSIALHAIELELVKREVKK